MKHTVKAKVKDLWGWAADMVLLNLLWFVASVPLVTAGAATAALWDVLFQRIRGDEPQVVSEFFRAFRKNFKRGTQLWLLTAALGLLFTVNFFISHIFRQLQILELVFIAFLLCLTGFSQYAFALVSQHIESFREIIQKAGFLLVGYLPKSLMITSIALLPLIAVILLSFGLYGVLLSIIFLTAASTWVNARILYDIFLSSQDLLKMDSGAAL